MIVFGVGSALLVIFARHMVVPGSVVGPFKTRRRVFFFGWAILAGLAVAPWINPWPVFLGASLVASLAAGYLDDPEAQAPRSSAIERAG